MYGLPEALPAAEAGLRAQVRAEGRGGHVLQGTRMTESAHLGREECHKLCNQD